MNFEGANLRGAKFVNASLAGANFRKADLLNADFGGANLSRADFSGAVNVSQGSFSNGSGKACADATARFDPSDGITLPSCKTGRTAQGYEFLDAGVGLSFTAVGHTCDR